MFSLAQSSPVSPLALLSFLSVSIIHWQCNSRLESFWWGLPWTGFRLVKLISGLLQSGGKWFIPLWVSRKVPKQCYFGPQCVMSLLIKHFYKLLCLYFLLECSMCVQRVELGVVLITIAIWYPGFLLLLLYLGLTISDFSNCPPSLPEVNSSAPFAPSVPQKYRRLS